MSLGSTLSYRVESPNRGRESIKEFACRGVGSSEDGRPKSGHGSQGDKYYGSRGDKYYGSRGDKYYSSRGDKHFSPDKKQFQRIETR